MCYNNASHANTCVLNLCHSSKPTVSVFFFLTHIQIWWKFLIFVFFFYPSQILCCFHVANAAPPNMTTAQCCCCFLKLVWHQVCALTLNVSEIRHPSRRIKNMYTKVSLTLSPSLPHYLLIWLALYLSINRACCLCEANSDSASVRVVFCTASANTNANC